MHDFSPRSTGPRDLDYAAMLSGYRLHLSGMMQQGISALAVERVFLGIGRQQSDQSKMVGAIYWVSLMVAYEHRARRHIASATEIRSWLIGRPRRLKGESDRQFDHVIAAALAERGVVATSEHASDAAALALYCIDKEKRALPFR